MADATVKVALVTGASAGIGRATARLLAERGVTVYAAARRCEPLEALAGETPGVRPLALDVTSDGSVRAALERISSEGAEIDLLVNNAGYGQMGAVEELPLERLRYQLEVNVVGAVRMVQGVLPGMRARSFGRIVNVSSPAALLAMPLGGAYAASKAALELLTSALRLETRELGIAVILVRPGAILTEFQEVARRETRGGAGDSPYARTYRAVGRFFEEVRRRGSPPEPVALAIVRAALAARPPVEVNVPLDAKAGVALAAWLPNTARDGLVRLLVDRLAGS